MAQIHPQTTPADIEAPDPWHAHTAEEGMPQQAHTEEVNARLVIGVGIGLFVAVVAVTVLIYGYFTWFTVGLLQEREARGLEVETLKYRNAALLTLERGYEWVSHDVVQLPLDVAKQKVIAEYTGQGR